MKVVKNLLYTKDHEWIKLEGEKVYIGITDYAQNALGEIVFVELPELNVDIEKEDSLGAVESVKSVSDVYSPVSGKIVEVNEELGNEPGFINSDPYKMWIAAIKFIDKSELEGLMTSGEYEQFCSEE